MQPPITENYSTRQLANTDTTNDNDTTVINQDYYYTFLNTETQTCTYKSHHPFLKSAFINVLTVFSHCVFPSFTQTRITNKKIKKKSHFKLNNV